jgi:hypothetical protein
MPNALGEDAPDDSTPTTAPPSSSTPERSLTVKLHSLVMKSP